MSELTSELMLILADYEGRGRNPQMVLEVIEGLTREIEEECGALPTLMEKVRQVVQGWKEGHRPEMDALQSIAGLVRQG